MDDLEESWDGEGEVARRRGSRKERVAPVLVVRKKEDEAGAKAEEAGPLPDSQGLNFSPSLYLLVGTEWYRLDFISPVHKTFLYGAARRALK